MTLFQLLVWTLQSAVTAIAIFFAAGVIDALIFELRCEYEFRDDDRNLFRWSRRRRSSWSRWRQR